MAKEVKDKKAGAKPSAKAKKEVEHGDDPAGMPRLFEKYTKVILPGMMKQFSYKSVMQVPRLKKI